MTNFDDIGERVIETIDENGNKVFFELVEILDVEEQEYALLLPINEDENDDELEEDEYIVMRLIKEGEDYLFEEVSDEEFEKVEAYIENMEEDE